MVSPWHEVSLYANDGSLHYVNEIPRETSAKMELATTWEDPAKIDPILNVKGDNDPVDVVEIGSQVHTSGGVYKVKPLGVYAMIDSGELDWKVIAISVDDPKAALVNDVADVEKHFPGELAKIHAWFRDYKISDSKCQDKAFAMHVIEETGEAYLHHKSGACKHGKELSLI